jgi:hypothetical protein
LLTLRVLLTCYGLYVGLGPQRCCLLLLRSFFGVDSSELVRDIHIFLCCALAFTSHIHEVTLAHRSVSRFCLLRHIHKLIWATKFFRPEPAALLFLL